MYKKLRTFLIITFSVLFLFSGFMVVQYYVNSHKQNAQFENLANMVNQVRPPRPEIPVTTAPVSPDSPTTPTEPTEPVVTDPPGPLPEYIEVSALNEDMVGWLQIEGTKVDYPVLQTPDDPEFYLKKDFYGQYSSHGCLFTEEDCDVDLPSDNITIYGHNMKDGSMFAPILGYHDKNFWQSHRYIYFDTLYERHTYEVFAILITTASKGQGFSYHQFVDAKSEKEFQDFIDKCKDLSLYETGITPVYGDKLITLSTCEYTQKNGRFVVVARRVV